MSYFKSAYRAMTLGILLQPSTPIDFEQFAGFSERALTKFQDPLERVLLCLMHLIWKLLFGGRYVKGVPI